MVQKMHFKLFLKLDHKEVEVRRLSCEVSSDYENFRNLVRKAFNYLPSDDFLLTCDLVIRSTSGSLSRVDLLKRIFLVQPPCYGRINAISRKLPYL